MTHPNGHRALTFGHCLALRRDRFHDGAPVPGTVEVAGILVPDASIDPESAESVAAAVDAAVERFRALQLACKAPTRLRDVGVKREDLAALSLRVNPERLKNDALAPSKDDLLTIMNAAF